MPSIQRFLLVAAALAGLVACAPLPGTAQLDTGHQVAAAGDWDRSIDAFSEAVTVATDKSVIQRSLGGRCEALTWKGRNEAAMEDCNNAIRAAPDGSGYPYAVRGRLFAMMGQYEWALEDFDRAMALKSAGANNARVVAWGSKARVFATCPDAALRDGARGIQFAEKAVSFEDRLGTPAYRILNRDTLAAAYAEAGRFADAVARQKETIALVRDNGWGGLAFGNRTLLDVLGAHLKVFEAGRPLRGGVY